MNNNQKNYIKKQLSLNKSIDTEINHEELMQILNHYGIEFPIEATKKQLVDLLFQSPCCDNFIDKYEYRFLIPAFRLAKFYDLTTNQINKLSDIGIIDDPYATKNINTNRRGTFISRCYSTIALDKYNREDLILELNKIEQYDLGIRIEVHSEELIEEVVSKLKKAFSITSDLNIFPSHSRNDGKGYYVYLQAQIHEEVKKKYSN